MTTNNYLSVIAGALQAEGLTKSNYSRELAKQILSQTVMPNFCTRILLEKEEEIINQLP